jgi:tetratricopeptide (TPR) repeat protein
MLKRSLQLFMIFTALFLSGEYCLNAAETSVPAVSAAAADSTINIDKNNQMMLVFVERLKSGDTKEARKIAKEMADFSKNYKDDEKTVYKSFYSNIEKELYILKNKNSKKNVVWVKEPIADGYYFLAVMDFNEKNYKDAIDNIQKCITWNPVRAPYYCERGFIFLNCGVNADYVSAQVAYEQALEYADNEEDFASALRGLGFAFASRNELEESAAAMILSEKFVPNNPDAQEHILRLKSLVPSFDFNMDIKKATKILKESHIQTTFSPDHSKVLLKLASEMKMPEEKEKALVFLIRANMLDPNNKDVEKKLKEVQMIK